MFLAFTPWVKQGRIFKDITLDSGDFHYFLFPFLDHRLLRCTVIREKNHYSQPQSVKMSALATENEPSIFSTRTGESRTFLGMDKRSPNNHRHPTITHDMRVALITRQMNLNKFGGKVSRH